MIRYPDDKLPLPNASPYDWNVGLGVVNAKMNAGNRVLRRLFNHLPHQFGFAFSMNSAQMSQFTAFIDKVGSDWFMMPSLSMWTGSGDNFIGDIPVRFTSDARMSADGFNWWNVTIDAEISPNVFWDSNASPWIDAGFAYAASPGWIDGGISTAPSPTWVDAGLADWPSGSGGAITPPVTPP